MLLERNADRHLVAMNGCEPIDLAPDGETKAALSDPPGMKRKRSLSSGNSIMLEGTLPSLADKFCQVSVPSKAPSTCSSFAAARLRPPMRRSLPAQPTVVVAAVPHRSALPATFPGSLTSARPALSPLSARSSPCWWLEVPRSSGTCKLACAPGEQPAPILQ